MGQKKRSISNKMVTLLLATVFLTMLLVGMISIYSLYSMKQISIDNSQELGYTAAADAEEALENMAGEQLQEVAMEKAAYIEEKYNAIEAYVHGIATQAEDIYQNPQNYPERVVNLPIKKSDKLAAQLLWSDKLTDSKEKSTTEILKLGNIQDLLVQYNANNEMVSSTYVATASGWMIQADYIAYSKYEKDSTIPICYDAETRQWYQRAKKAAQGEVIYTDVIADVHAGGDCIVCAQPIYLEGQVVAVAGVGSYLETVNTAVLNTTIGKSGYAFLVNENGQIMVSPMKDGETSAGSGKNLDLRKSHIQEMATIAEAMVAGQTGVEKLTIDDKEVYLAYAPLKNLGWSFVTIIDVEEVVAPAKESQNMILQLTDEVAGKQDEAIHKMLLILLTVLLLAGIIITIMSMLFTRKITDPIRQLTTDVARMDGGNLDYRIEIDTGDEVEDLSHAFNAMTDKIQQYISNLATVTSEKERIRTELQVASQIQSDMLPDSMHILNNRAEFTIHATMTPAKEVGGDFYDFFLLDEDHLALLVADVSGKGVPASLFMVVAMTLIQSSTANAATPAQAFQNVNNALCRNNKNGMFVTAWIGVLTISTGNLTYVNAGHNSPLFRQRGGVYTYIKDRTGFVLAGMENLKYQQRELQLMPGDSFFLYTDGVTEAHDEQCNLYGDDRLEQLLNSNKQLAPKEMTEIVWKDITAFQGKAEQFDDITMLAFCYHGDGYEKYSGIPELCQIQEVTGFVEEQLKKVLVSKEAEKKILIAVDEIFSNICHYSKATKVTVGCKVTEEEIYVFFEDDGVPYNPLKQAEPDIAVPMEQRKEGGLGIYLVKNYMDKVTYKHVNGKNHLHMEKSTEI